MRPLVLLLALVATTRIANADAALSGEDGAVFPTDVGVSIEIRAQVEMTTIVLAFAPIEEGDYVLTVPSPPGGYVVGVDLDRGAGFFQAPMVGEAPPPALGGSDSATDPVVADWLGTTPLRADLADLSAGPLVVRVRFQRLLRRVHGEVAFVTGVRRSPLRSAGDPGARVSLSLALATFRSLVLLDVIGATETERTPTTAAYAHQGVGDAPIVVRYAEQPSDIGINFLVHRTPTADPLGGSEGYFLLVIDADDASVETAQPRSLSLVVDESGSMTGVKIEQARDVARVMLDRLGAIDSVNVIAFDDLVRSFRNGPVPASASNLVAARSFVDTIAADGATDIDAALRAGLTGIGPETERFDAMILLSDGMATAGETRDVQIHANSLLYNQAKARVFTFSIGTDADLPLMEALARSHRGRHVALNNAQAASEIVARVDELFEDIRMPRLTDLEVGVLNVGAGAVLPDPMTDLFSGGQAILVGRYATPGPATIRIEGDDNAAPFVRMMVADAPAFADANELIKYVWATERVGHLLADMSRGGDVAALVDEITELGLAYRIQTPYTSFSTRGLGGGDPGGGGGGGGDGWGGGASGPVELAVALLLVWAARRRRAEAVT